MCSLSIWIWVSTVFSFSHASEIRTNDQTPETASAANQVPQWAPKDEASETYAPDFNFLPLMDTLEHVATPSSVNLNGTNSPDTCNDSRITRASLDKQRREPTAELLRMHNKFVHVNFSRLRVMVRNGVLPKSLADCPLPALPACMVRPPTQTKAKKSVNPARKYWNRGIVCQWMYCLEKPRFGRTVEGMDYLQAISMCLRVRGSFFGFNIRPPAEKTELMSS
jgi:hypothetical protein